MKKSLLYGMSCAFVMVVYAAAWAESDMPQAPDLQVPSAATESIPAESTPAGSSLLIPAEEETGPDASEEQKANLAVLSAQNVAAMGTVGLESVRYTLGPDDVIQIDVRRHPEFSGTYPINLEGKIQIKFVGDIEVNDLTKEQLKERLSTILKQFILDPDVEVTILEYRSKVIYVVGEVGRPGKYFMRADSISVREAVVAAGLPMLTASMRKTRIVTPTEKGKAGQKKLDLYKLLYEGDLSLNFDMKPGDVLYVPATIMAKVMRVLNPVTSTVSSARGAGGLITP